MKKIISLLVAFTLFLTLTAPGYAKAKTPTMPNLRDKTTINALKTGTYSFNGVKLGDTSAKIQKQWGKSDMPVTYSVLKSYDGMLLYGEDDFVMAYLDGKRGLKKSAYTLKSINIMPADYTFSITAMKKYWGKHQYSYVQAGTKNYIYGNTILTYAKFDKHWEFAGFGYGDTTAIQEVEAAFAR